MARYTKDPIDGTATIIDADGDNIALVPAGKSEIIITVWAKGSHRENAAAVAINPEWLLRALLDAERAR